MLSSAVRFAEDAAGIEKTLRLLQGFCTIIVGLSQSIEEAMPWAQARSQLALGRKYFRLLKWHPCWSSAYRAFNAEQTPLLKLLEVAKWCFLGFYFFLEMPTITNTMKATDFEWGPILQLEANKCWVYAIVFSILGSLYRLLQGEPLQPSVRPGSRSTNNADDKEKPRTSEAAAGRTSNVKRTAIFRQIVVDSCDLVIAGSSVGWIDVSDVQVGTAYVISSAVAGQALWDRVQSGAS